MSDLFLFICTVVGFATVVTAHLGTVVGLVRRHPRWRGAVALFAMPLAPYWAVREGLWVRATCWLAGAALYGFSLAAQRLQSR